MHTAHSAGHFNIIGVADRVINVNFKISVRDREILLLAFIRRTLTKEEINISQMVYEMTILACSMGNPVHHDRWERLGYTEEEIQISIAMVKDGKFPPYVHTVLNYYAEIYP